jgi:hypothetical protein
MVVEGGGVTIVLESDLPVSPHMAAITRALFPVALLSAPASSSFLPETTVNPLFPKLYLVMSLHTIKKAVNPLPPKL